MKKSRFVKLLIVWLLFISFINTCLSSKQFRHNARKASLLANIGLLNPLGLDVNMLANEWEIQPSIEQLALAFNNLCKAAQLFKIYLLFSSMISSLSGNFLEKSLIHYLNAERL